VTDETLDPQKERAWAQDQPAVEVQSPSAVSVRHDNRQFLRDKPEACTVDYHAGWIRSDQALADVNGSNSGDLTDLSTEPPRLPDDIRRVGLLLTLYEVSQAEHAPGVGSIEHTIGAGGTIQVGGMERGFVERHLRQLADYKQSPF